MDVGIRSLSAQFSLDHSDSEAIKELYEIARSNAIRIEQSQTSTPLQLLPDLVETRLNVSAVGSYAALKNFVKLVTRSPRFFAVESISVSSDGTKPNGTVNFRVQIIMWRQHKGNMQSNAAAKGV